MNDSKKKDFILSKMVTELEVTPDSPIDIIHIKLGIDRAIYISSFLSHNEREIIAELNKEELYYYLKTFFIDTKENEETEEKIKYLRKKAESYKSMYEHYKDLYKQLVKTKEDKNGK